LRANEMGVANEQKKLDEQISAIEERARVGRRASILLTFVPLILMGAVVVGFAYDIRQKRAEVAAMEDQKRKLDAELREEQEKLKKAEAAGEELDAKTSKLRDEKKELEDYLRGLREKGPERIIGGEVEAPPSVVLTAEGEGRDDFRPAPKAQIKPRPSGRAYEVTLSLDLPQAKLDSIQQVTYELNPLFYFVRHELTVTKAPFEAELTVYACKSTVLAKIVLKNGSKIEVDYDWCRAEGWPPPKQEQVEQEPEKGAEPKPPGPPNPRPPGLFPR